MKTRILREIAGIMERHPEKRERYSLVLAGSGWHRGVIGIVAQRVVERYHRPTLVISVDNGLGVGSGRSIKALHLFDALTAVQDLFERFGGHSMAAGFALPAARIAELETRFEQCGRSVLKPRDLEQVLRVDAEVSGADVDWNLLEAIETLPRSAAVIPPPSWPLGIFASC